MRFSLAKSDLLQSLSHIQSVVERKNTIPILAHVLIRSLNDTTIELQASDMDVFITETLPAHIEEQGSMTLEAHVLYDIVRKLPDHSSLHIQLDSDISDIASLSCGKIEFKLPSLKASDFPKIPEINTSATLKIKTKDLIRAIDLTKFAISQEETRYYLGGLYWHQDQQHIAIVATDGHRLAKTLLNPQSLQGEFAPIIIPKKMVAEMRKLIEGQDQEITINMAPNRIELNLGSCHLQSKLIDGNFPDYKRVIPEKKTTGIALHAKVLSTAIDRVTTIIQDKNSAIKWAITTDNLKLSAAGGDQAKAQEDLSLTYAGDPINLGFNARYVQDILAVAGDKSLQAFLQDGVAPALFDLEDDTQSLFVIMPMRV